MSSSEGMAFLQLQKPRKQLSNLAETVIATIHQRSDDNPLMSHESNEQSRKRDLIVDMLKRSSVELKSPTLAMLASKVAADPFVKIKKLIQELIERLLQEAADEANHKGWCDKETGKAKQSRDTK